MSGAAAKEINEILLSAVEQIDGIVLDTNKTVDGLINQVDKKIENGTIVSYQCKETFEQIASTINTLNEMMSTISVAVKEQTKGYSEITQAMQEIDHGVHDSLNLADKTSQYANELNTKVFELKKIATTIESEVLGNNAG